MNKGITILKKTFKAILWIVISFILLLIITGLLLKIPDVQSEIAGKVSTFLSKKISADAEVKRISISFLGTVAVEGIYFADKENDTLIYTSKASVRISIPDLLKKKLHIMLFSLEDLDLNIQRSSSDSLFNYSFILSAFDDTAAKKINVKKSSDWEIQIDQASLINLRLRYIDEYGGMNATGVLNTLSLKMNKTDIPQSVFEIDSLLTDGLNADILIKNSKEKKSEKSDGKLPFVSAKYMKLNNINLDYNDLVQKQEVHAGIMEFGLTDASLNMRQDSILIGDFVLAQSGIKLINNVPEQFPDTTGNNIGGNNDWYIYVKSMDFNNNSIEFRNNNSKKINNVFDINNLNYKDISLNAEDLIYSPGITAVTVNKLTASGDNFQLNQFETRFRMDPHSLSAENLKIKTSRSSVDADIKLEYPSLEKIRDSSGLMILDIDLKYLILENSELTYFSPELRKIDFFKNNKVTTTISGHLSGPVNDLLGENLLVSTGSYTTIQTGFRIKGLPSVQTALYNVGHFEIKTGKNDFLMFAGSLAPSSIDFPEEVAVSGSFNGTMKTFESSLDVKSTYGAADANFSIDSGENFNGNIKISGFDLGSLMKNDSVYGKLSLTADIKGHGLKKEDINASFKAEVQEIGLNNYLYHNLNLNGSISGSQFTGNINLKDENAAFDLNAFADLKQGSESFKISLNLPGADLQKLNLSKNDIRIGFKMNTDFTGNSLNNLNGKASISGLSIFKEKEQLSLDSIKLFVQNDGVKTELNLRSQLADIDYNGELDIAELAQFPLKFINRYFPFQDSVIQQDSVTWQDFNFKISIHDNPVLRLLLPKLTEFMPGEISGNYDGKDNKMNFSAAIDRMVYAGTEINNLDFDIGSDPAEIGYKLSGKLISAGQFHINNFLLEGKIADSSVVSGISATDEEGKARLKVHSAITREKDAFMVRVNPDELYLMNNQWTIPEDNYILFGKKGLLIHNISLSGGGSEISVASVNDRFKDDLKIVIKNFDLDYISGIVKKDTSLVKGILNGNILLKRVNDTYGIIADAGIENLAVREVPLGNLSLRTENPEPERFNIALNLTGSDNDLKLNGFVITNPHNTSISAELSLNSLSMKTLEAFSMGAITDAEGTLTGKLSVSGEISSPVINGQLTFNKAFITPAALNNRLQLVNETVLIKDDGIYFNSFKILDSKENMASIDGSVRMKNFSDFVFALKVSAANFLLFNTTEKDNENFFGRLIIDSQVELTGPLTLPVINARLKMKEGSYFTFAVIEKEMTTSRGEGAVDFENATELSPVLSVNKAKEKKGPSGFDITSVIEIDKKATLRVLLDPATHDSLVVKGDAALSLTVDPSGKISLTGGYNVTEGSYVVSLESLIKKSFDIKSGSTITWDGDPMDADVSIDAGYPVRASPIDLVADQMGGMSETDLNAYKQRYPFDVLLKLRGKMLNPEISFEIQMKEEDKGILGGAVNAKLNMLAEDPSALNKQVFALLILGRFIQEDPLRTDAASSTVRSTVGKFLSDQLNKWSSGLVTGLELNFDIQSYNDYQSGKAEGRTQMDIGVKQQLFNERLSVQLEGVVGVEGEAAKQNSVNDLTSNVTVEYKLTKDQRLRLKGFRHNRYDGAIEGLITETGAGLVYVRDFNKWKEFFRSKNKRSGK